MPGEQPLISDEELARQSQGGSLAAFEELVHRYERRIYCFLTNFCGSTDARDLTQETFVKAFQAISQYKPRFTFAAWLFTIARRKCIDRYRTTPPEPETLALPPNEQPDPSEVLARSEDSSALWTLAAKRLPAVQYQALWLRYVEDLAIADIARVLRKTRTHVKVLLFRARQALGRELQAAGQGTPALTKPYRPAVRPASDKRPSKETARLASSAAPRANRGRLGFSLAGRKG